MPLQLIPLTLSIFLLSLSFSSSSVAQRRYPDRCGSLQISYPFGVGPNCSMAPSFDISCEGRPPKPYINFGNYKDRMIEVVEISPTQVRVKYPYLLAVSCYNTTPPFNGMGFPSSVYLGDGQYTLSGENWLTALGCDDMVAGFGEKNGSFAGGCVSYCESNDPHGFGLCPNNESGTSAGNGCCQSPIPKGTTYLKVDLNDISGTRQHDRYFSCSYAFVEEKGISNQSTISSYPFSDLNKRVDPINDDHRWMLTRVPPVVRLDWRIGAENCSEARRNSTSYACKSNSDCVNFEDNGLPEGYLCRCIKGYDGNPYVDEADGGCKDVDECASDTTNPCDSNSICINTPGNVNCSCREGFLGDGMKSRMGCIRAPSKIANVIIGVGFGLGFPLFLSLCTLLHVVLQKRRNKLRKHKFFKKNGGLLLQQQTNEGTIIQKTKLFSGEELEKATDNFNENRIIGQGGQGTVYKGMLFDGKIVAIKKSKLVNRYQLEQFINEVVILSQINHRNVVKLLGCCLEIEVPLLVYEFVSNGTLFDFIHDPNFQFHASWNTRLKIAADIVGALAYLHSALSVPIFHRDIKSSNILLDEKYTVKLSDFGISKSVEVDRTHLTTLVKGTFGYFDPEYFQTSQYFTDKSDVYSFGVVLVELLTGQRPISLDLKEEEKSLVTRFLESVEQSNFPTLLDPQVSKHGKDLEVTTVVFLAKRCLNPKGKMRPTMKEVSTELERLLISEETEVYEANSTVISATESMRTNSSVSEISSL